MSSRLAQDRSPLSVLVYLMAVAIISLGFCAVSTVQAQDEVGIYWDAAFTEPIGATPTIPGVITGYVVLHDPSGTGGVLGWEACIDAEGPGTLSGWDLQGQGINVGSGTCLTVGYAAPLPQAANILLASFSLIATDVGPIELTMKPAWASSLPDLMSYIPGDSPGDLIAMTTTTGREIVAGVNGANPWLVVDQTEIDFGTIPLGETASRSLVLTNTGPDPIALNLLVSEFCDFFGLPGGAGPVTVPGLDSLVIEVTFSPFRENQVTCELSLGTGLPVIPLLGAGVAPVTSWLISGSGSFGNVDVGQSQERTVYLTNTGQTVIHLDAAFRDSCPDFLQLEGVGPADLNPGDVRAFRVRFSPTVSGYQECFLAPGFPGIPDIFFYGFGVGTVIAWDAPTSHDFLANYVNVPATAGLTVTNIGTEAFPLFASLPAGCQGFTILQGGGYSVDLQPGQSHGVLVEFNASATGHYQCFLDLGDVVPDIQLDGDAIASPNSVTVTPSQLIFPTTLVTQNVEMDIIIASTVAYDVPLDLQIVAPGSVFSVTAGGGAQVLPTGTSLTVTVRFEPGGPIDYNDVLELGEPFPQVALSGTGHEGTPACRIEPASLNLGTVVLGQFAELPVTITNDGDVDLLLEPETTSPEFLVDVAPLLLGPGQSRTYAVRYEPTALGSVSGLLLLGDQACNAVSLLGNAVIDADLFVVVPDTIDIPAVPVNTIVDRDVLITNNTGYALDLNVEVLEPSYGFFLLQGGGPGLLPPGDSQLIVVRFFCPAERTYATNLFFGPGLPLVPLFAEGVVIRPDCELDDTVLNFGTTPLGIRRYRYIGITNNSDSDLVLMPVSDSADFEVSSDPVVIAPDAATTLEVIFRPTQVGTTNGSIDLGNGSCMDVRCYGEGVPAQSSDQDLLGIFFDSQYSQNFGSAWQIGQILPAYLVLSSPSNGGGILGWECKVEADGPTLLTGWSLAGQAINLGQEPEFIVGVAAPLPYMDQTVLATFECLITGLGQETVLRVLPVRQASIPDAMAWVPGDFPDVLLYMNPLFGQPEVAFINSGIVGIEAPTPLAQLLGQQVDLSWPAPTGPNEGCHVYRRLADDQTAVRLTDRPVTTTGARLTYTDVTSGLAPGATVFYSYAIVSDGAELVRSPEVAITLPALPAMVTRLLPNVPNPFNPMTEIRFELGHAQHVSVKIYDVTGRLVRELENGSLAAGPYSRVWQGRDNHGRQVPSGAYYVRLVTNGMVDNQKIMLLK